MPEILTTAGTKVYIGPQVTSAIGTLAEFDALSYTEIKKVQSIGEFGDEAKTVTSEDIGDARVRKAKGSRDAGQFEMTVSHDPSDAGQTAVRAAELTNFPYAIKVVPNDPVTPDATPATVTITIASPGVVTWTGHGLVNGCQVVLTTTGALPTGLTAGTTYYVVNKTANTFELAATPGGTSIVTSGSQSGVHTGNGHGSPTTYYFRAFVNSDRRSFGTNDTVLTRKYTCPITSAIVERTAV